MTVFYKISHNSFYNKGFPWIIKIVNGLTTTPICAKCGTISRYPKGDIAVQLDRKKGNRWPDVLGCGSEPLLIISNKVVDAWDKEKIEAIPKNRVYIEGPYPKKLENEEPPEYYWVDGKMIVGASFDFKKSGFIDVSFCDSCGHLSYNIKETHALQNSKICPYAFNLNSMEGKNLFTTNYSYFTFFCTQKLFNCAKKNKFTNFRFTKTEDGKATGSKGINYLT